MSEIIGMVALSHSPFATLLPPADPEQPGGRFLTEAARLSRAVERLAPDAVVVIGPDHFHGNFYDAMPPFLLGVEHATGFGDFGSRSGPLPVAGELAWSVYDGLTGAGFDLSLSYSLTVDHGLVQSYEMVCAGAEIPMVPLVVNTAAPPLPTMERCIGFGRALGDALRDGDGTGRVLIIASGGLSHWLPSNDPRDPAMAEERRHAVIHGREAPAPSRSSASTGYGRWAATGTLTSTAGGTAGSSSSWVPESPGRSRPSATRVLRSRRAAGATRSAPG